MASHRTAAFLWGLDSLGGAPALIEVTAPFDVRRRVSLARVHHTRRIPEPPARRDRIPTTPLARTLLDLSEVLTDELVFIAFDSAQRKFKRVLSALEDELRRNGDGRHRRQSLVAMVQRSTGDRSTESALEAKAAFAIDRRGLSPPHRQHVVRDPAGSFIARVDFAWLDQRVILQCDSRKWHLSPGAFEKDLRQRRQLESHGWRVLHVSWQMLASSDWLVDLARLLEAQSVALSGLA